MRPSKHNKLAYRENESSTRQVDWDLSRKRMRIEHVMVSLKRFRILAERFPFAISLYNQCIRGAAIILDHQVADMRGLALTRASLSL
ncbi:transposase [Noviherbaspirillum album]|uniref:transposase n=1 Tax=Noviherbaspirillum album TaxID=3080276 RepID=UPI00345FDBE2